MNKTIATRVVHSLAKQDKHNGDTGPAEDQIRRWRQSGRESGDLLIVDAIDALGLAGAARTYRSASKSNKAGTKRPAKRSSNRAGSMTTAKKLAEYARHTAADNGVDVATAIRMMRDEYPTVASDLRIRPAAVKTWCDAKSSNRAGTKRRATKKTANKAGKRRNRAGTPKRSARTGRFLKAR